MTDLRKAAEMALEALRIQGAPLRLAALSKRTAAIDALRAALEHDRRAALNFVHQALQDEARASISYVQPDEQTYGFEEPKP